MHVICSGQMLRLVHCVLSFVYCPLSMVHSPLSTMYCLLSTVYGLSTVCSTIQGIATFQSSVLLHCNKQRCACSCTVPRNHTKEEGCLPAGPGQAGHALPPPPMGMGGMQMGGVMQPAPTKKPAVPDWVRQELLKRGLHSDAAGGRCTISCHAIFCKISLSLPVTWVKCP